MAPNTDVRLRYFYQSELDSAKWAWRRNDKSNAEEICRSLVTDLACPAFTQIKAWQLRSLCTDQYYDARAHLEEALQICEALSSRNVVVAHIKEETHGMLREMERMWEEKCADDGRVAPTREELEKENREAGEEEGEVEGDDGLASDEANGSVSADITVCMQLPLRDRKDIVLKATEQKMEVLRLQSPGA